MSMKIVTVNPGKLGLTVSVPAATPSKTSAATTGNSNSAGGVIIKSINPKVCTFQDEISIGDKLLTIDGKPINSIEDLKVGNDRVRQLGILPIKQADDSEAEDQDEDNCSDASDNEDEDEAEAKSEAEEEEASNFYNKKYTIANAITGNMNKRRISGRNKNKKRKRYKEYYDSDESNKNKKNNDSNNNESSLYFQWTSDEEGNKIPRLAQPSFVSAIEACTSIQQLKYHQSYLEHELKSTNDRIEYLESRCKQDGCNNKAQLGSNGKIGYCKKHGGTYDRSKRPRIICSVEGCTTICKAGMKGVCMKHTENKPHWYYCTVDGCRNKRQRGKLCARHGADIPRCKVEGCDKWVKRSGLCSKHLRENEKVQEGG